MPRKFHVFLSCSGQDTDLAEHLFAELESVGVKVWFYKHQPQDDGYDETKVKRGLVDSDHLVALVTDDYIKSLEWVKWEIDDFNRIRRNDPGRRMVAILRNTRALPPELDRPFHTRVAKVQWSSREAQPERCLWRTYCEVMGKPSGPSYNQVASWNAMVARFRGSRPAGQRPELHQRGSGPHSPTVERGVNQLVLDLDRADQWGNLLTHLGHDHPETIFVPGPRGQGHWFFLERSLRLPGLGWQSHKVRWSGPPVTQEDFRNCLAASLRCEPPELIQRLSRELREGPVVFVHAWILDSNTKAGVMEKYYMQVLPALIQDLPADLRGRFKTVQAIQCGSCTPPAALVANSVKHLSLTWIPILGAWSRETSWANTVQKFWKYLDETGRSDGLRVVVLNPLGPIPTSDIEQWVSDVGQTGVCDTTTLKNRIAYRSRDTEDLFTRAVTFLDGCITPSNHGSPR